MDPGNLVDLANEMRYLPHDKLKHVKPVPKTVVIGTDISQNSARVSDFVDTPFISPLPQVVIDSRSPCEIFGVSTRVHARK